MSAALPSSVPAGHVLIRVAYAGVNASDVNFSAGRYQASIAEAQASLPFDAGFEAVGAVAAVGPQVSGVPNLTAFASFLLHNWFPFSLSIVGTVLPLLCASHSICNVHADLSHCVAAVMCSASTS